MNSCPHCGALPLFATRLGQQVVYWRCLTKRNPDGSVTQSNRCRIAELEQLYSNRGQRIEELAAVIEGLRESLAVCGNRYGSYPVRAAKDANDG